MCICNGATNKCEYDTLAPPLRMCVCVCVCVLHIAIVGNNLRNKIKIFYFNGAEAVALFTPKAQKSSVKRVKELADSDVAWHTQC